jgi:Secretion system C-terminal sorting domain/FG-GAP-like repeat
MKLNRSPISASLLFFVVLVPIVLHAEMHMFTNPIPDYVDRSVNIEPCDVNADGLMDVFGWLHYLEDMGIYAYVQDDNGAFSEHLLQYWPGWKYDLSAVDWDQDGDSDFVLASDSDYGPDLTVFINQGNYVFHLGPTLYDPGVQQVEAADLDGDGDIDLAVDRDWWWENQEGSFVQQPIVNPFGNPEYLRVLDIDPDANLELAVFQRDSLALFDIDDDGNLIRSYTNYDYGATEIITSDIDGDQIAELIIGQYFQVLILDRDDNDEWTVSSVEGDSAHGGGVHDKYQLHAVDFDADLDLDIMRNGVWFENTGENFLIHDIYNPPYRSLPYHQNDDHLIDFVSSGGSVFVHKVAASRNSYELLDENMRALHAADFNQDGLTDLLCMYFDFSFLVYLNDGDALVEGDLFSGLPDPRYREDFWVADVEGDGDLDVLSYEIDDNWQVDEDTFYVYLNDGSAQFEQTVFHVPDYPLDRICVGDIDLDSDVDFTAVYWDDEDNKHRQIFYQVVGGFQTQDLPFEDNVQNELFLPADYEGDGDIDLVYRRQATGGTTQRTYWMIQDNGEFTLSPNYTWPTYIGEHPYIGDLDQDGLIDVVDGDYIHWGEPDYFFDVEEMDLPYLESGSLRWEVYDVNNDDLVDILYVYNYKLYLYMNSGDRTFHFHDLNIGYNFGRFQVLDLNSDDDLDMVGSGLPYSPDATKVIENLLSDMPEMTLRLLPHTNPVFIPAQGGTFEFGLTLTNKLRSQLHSDIVFSVVHGDNSIVLDHFTPTLQPFEPIQILSLDQTVDASVPADTFTYRVRVWDEENWDFPLAEDSFTVIKETGVAGFGLTYESGWTLTGLPSSDPPSFDTAGIDTPTEYSLAPAYPNPFNAQTRIPVSLPESASATVRLYNVLGQQVTVIQRPNLPPGNHEIILSADNHSAGVYFLHVSTDTGWHVTQKLVLLK